MKTELRRPPVALGWVVVGAPAGPQAPRMSLRCALRSGAARAAGGPETLPPAGRGGYTEHDDGRGTARETT